MTDHDRLANEGIFPGNGAALAELERAIISGESYALTGAGTSVPIAPTWTGLLNSLLEEASTAGLVNGEDRAVLQSEIATDPLDMASSLEDVFTREAFRARLGQVFSLQERSSPAHETLVQLPLKGIVTLNYDDGLSTAYV